MQGGPAGGVAVAAGGVAQLDVVPEDVGAVGLALLPGHLQPVTLERKRERKRGRGRREEGGERVRN